MTPVTPSTQSTDRPDPPGLAGAPLTFDAEAATEPLVCPHCIEPINSFDHFCQTGHRPRGE